METNWHWSCHSVPGTLLLLLRMLQQLEDPSLPSQHIHIIRNVRTHRKYNLIQLLPPLLLEITVSKMTKVILLLTSPVQIIWTIESGSESTRYTHTIELTITKNLHVTYMKINIQLSIYLCKIKKEIEHLCCSTTHVNVGRSL